MFGLNGAKAIQIGSVKIPLNFKPRGIRTSTNSSLQDVRLSTERPAWLQTGHSSFIEAGSPRTSGWISRDSFGFSGKAPSISSSTTSSKRSFISWMRFPKDKTKTSSAQLLSQPPSLTNSKTTISSSLSSQSRTPIADYFCSSEFRLKPEPSPSLLKTQAVEKESDILSTGNAGVFKRPSEIFGRPVHDPAYWQKYWTENPVRRKPVPKPEPMSGVSTPASAYRTGYESPVPQSTGHSSGHSSGTITPPEGYITAPEIPTKEVAEASFAEHLSKRLVQLKEQGY